MRARGAADFAFLLHGFHYLKDNGGIRIIRPFGLCNPVSPGMFFTEQLDTGDEELARRHRISAHVVRTHHPAAPIDAPGVRRASLVVGEFKISNPLALPLAAGGRVASDTANQTFKLTHCRKCCGLTSIACGLYCSTRNRVLRARSSVG